MPPRIGRSHDPRAAAAAGESSEPYEGLAEMNDDHRECRRRPPGLVVSQLDSRRRPRAGTRSVECHVVRDARDRSRATDMSQRHIRVRWAAATVAVCVFLGGSTLAVGEVRFGVGVGVAVPGLSIGVEIPTYPQLVPIAGYPVYYAPGVGANLFFYDGLYWVFAEDNWYYSSWYDGPWYLAEPETVPDF